MDKIKYINGFGNEITPNKYGVGMYNYGVKLKTNLVRFSQQIFFVTAFDKRNALNQARALASSLGYVVTSWSIDNVIEAWEL